MIQALSTLLRQNLECQYFLFLKKHVNSTRAKSPTLGLLLSVNNTSSEIYWSKGIHKGQWDASKLSRFFSCPATPNSLLRGPLFLKYPSNSGTEDLLHKGLEGLLLEDITLLLSICQNKFCAS
jgi:hypothetical protein